MKNGWSLKKVMAVAAVAAAGVLGVTGMVWAGLPTGPTEAAKVSMTASYYVNQITELQATGKNIKDDGLKLAAAIDAAPSATNFGSLGTIRVRTNSSRWDIRMTTGNGGQMLDETSVECKDVDRQDVWGNKIGTDKDCSGSTPIYLTYNDGSDNVPVVLDVAIGVAKTGLKLGNSAAPTTLYPMADIATTPTFIPPVKVNPAGSKTTPISFAETFGNATKTGWGTFANGIYGGTSGGVDDWGTIGDDGFPTPKGNASPDLNEEFFYVNVGMPAAMFDALSGNKNKKTFTETFYFELVASF